MCGLCFLRLWAARSSHGFRIATWYLPAAFFNCHDDIGCPCRTQESRGCGFNGSPDSAEVVSAAISDSLVADAARLNLGNGTASMASARSVLDAAVASGASAEFTDSVPPTSADAASAGAASASVDATSNGSSDVELMGESSGVEMSATSSSSWYECGYMLTAVSHQNRHEQHTMQQNSVMIVPQHCFQQSHCTINNVSAAPCTTAASSRHHRHATNYFVFPCPKIAIDRVIATHNLWQKVKSLDASEGIFMPCTIKFWALRKLCHKCSKSR